MKKKFIDYYMDVAERTSKLSSAIRRQVGAVIVRENRILSYGYNGTPAGWDNACEDRVYPNELLGDYEQHPDEFESMFPNVDETGNRYYLKTKAEVLHAESNAIAKVSGSTESSEDAALFVTTAPCIDCAKLIYQSGIKSVYYRDTYRDTRGVDFLEKSGVSVTKYTVQV